MSLEKNDTNRTATPQEEIQDGSAGTASPSPAGSPEESAKYPGYRPLMLGEIIRPGDRCTKIPEMWGGDDGLLEGEPFFIGFEILEGDVGDYFRPLTSASESAEAQPQPSQSLPQSPSSEDRQ